MTVSSSTLSQCWNDDASTTFVHYCGWSVRYLPHLHLYFHQFVWEYRLYCRKSRPWPIAFPIVVNHWRHFCFVLTFARENFEWTDASIDCCENLDCPPILPKIVVVVAAVVDDCSNVVIVEIWICVIDATCFLENSWTVSIVH